MLKKLGRDATSNAWVTCGTKAPPADQGWACRAEYTQKKVNSTVSESVDASAKMSW